MTGPCVSRAEVQLRSGKPAGQNTGSSYLASLLDYVHVDQFVKIVKHSALGMRLMPQTPT